MLTLDVQLLEPGSEIKLYEVDGTAFNAPLLLFHNETIPYSPEEIDAIQSAGKDYTPLGKSIYWQGREYKPWPVAVEGLESSTDGSSASPSLSVGNIDGTVTALCLNYKDLAQAKVIIHETFAHYLDAENFPTGNDSADPTQGKVETWFINSKSSEDDEVVTFALKSPFDLQGLRIPTRQITSVCTWCNRGLYRTGDGCAYSGTNYFDKDGKPVDDPSLDECGGLLSDCQKRFGEHNEIDFGGFPGSALIRR